MSDRKLMVIEWLDHFDRSDWHHLDQIDLEPWAVRSVGWVTAEDDVAIALSTGIVESRARSGYTMVILKDVIVSSEEIVF